MSRPDTAATRRDRTTPGCRSGTTPRACACANSDTARNSRPARRRSRRWRPGWVPARRTSSRRAGYAHVAGAIDVAGIERRPVDRRIPVRQFKRTIAKVAPIRVTCVDVAGDNVGHQLVYRGTTSMGPDTQNGPCRQQCMDRFAVLFVVRGLLTPESMRMLDSVAAQSYSIVSVASGDAVILCCGHVFRRYRCSRRLLCIGRFAHRLLGCRVR